MRRVPSLILVLPLAAAIAACADATADSPLASPDPAHDAMTGDHAMHALHAAPGDRAAAAANNRDLALIRQATARYQRIDAAHADGFIPITPCVAHPDLGGMGHHYARLDLLMDAVIDPSLPEILLYEPEPNGRMRLVGVEFWVDAEPWYAAGNTAPPSVAGQEFDFLPAGVPEAHHPDNYALHVWVWKNNPSGMFAPFNPNVNCPAP